MDYRVKNWRFKNRPGVTTKVVLAAAVALLVVIGIVGIAYVSNVTSKSTTSSATSSSSSIDDPYLFASPSQLTLNAGGSSFVNPIMQVWYFNYADLTNGAFQLSYVSIGSGAGITGILGNEQGNPTGFEFAGSDAPVPASDLANVTDNTLLQIPEALGGVAIFYNVPGIDNASLDLTGPILAGIWNETITMWNAPQIVALNPNVPLPDQAIVPTHRSDGSGTTYAFTTYLSEIDPDWNATIGVGTVVNWPANELAAAGSGGIAGLVAETPYSIGYVDTYYASNNEIPIAAIENSSGNFVLPTVSAIASAASDFASQLQSDPTTSITDAPGATSYPISTFTYLLVWENQANKVDGDAAATFFWYIVHWGQADSPTLGYAPLPSNVVSIDEGLIKEINYQGQAYIQ